MLKEKENIRELDNLLLLTENKQIRLTITELENKQREETIKKLMNEREESESKLFNYSVRMKNMEDDLLQKRNEIGILNEEMFHKSSRLEEQLHENQELKNLLRTTQNLCESEKIKADKYRSFCLQGNSKLVESENLMKRYQSKVASLESRLQTAQNEVKSKGDKSKGAATITSHDILKLLHF